MWDSGKGGYAVHTKDKGTVTAVPTVTYMKSTDNKAAETTIPATVTVNGIAYKVTGIAANAFANNKKITKVTIGKNALKGTNKGLIIKAPKKKAAAYMKFFKKKGNKKVTVR